ncbi:N-glycosylase/DNA lyase [Schizosaccharomyces japonicus yFS275]|uniref:Copper transport protein n=1 Tax=Schizosaccharomyces japonicus (strain yFS275 / FY16936) TaxID=402676 RepID=B6JZT0_SCHJY|nr:N-glycosylase/DNA lyase [Schizosaccharomyces japonicus yFS275]EEB06080.1 N-glycosylase/DNA lyase [Schizosaccharomyces japonicus yFS275]
MWKKIPLVPEELNISVTLTNGQAFRWVCVDEKEKIYAASLWSCVVLLKQKHETDVVEYCFKYPENEVPNESKSRKLLFRYLNVDVDTRNLFQLWEEKDPTFAQHCKNLYGVRILKQDPWENLISFICSSNNNIPRISQMLQKLCSSYGTWLGYWFGHDFYSFPSLSKLASISELERELRNLGFGYRAKFIHKSVLYLSKNKGFLENLSSLSYEACRDELCLLPGVGPKVADCVCLMSLNKFESIPVDTHVLQLAVRDYKIWPRNAHSVLFTNEIYKRKKSYCLGFQSLHVQGPFTVILAAIGMFLLSFLYEALRSFRLNIEEKPNEKRYRNTYVTLSYALQACLSLYLMLCAMSFNGFVIIPIIFGGVLGYRVFPVSARRPDCACH